MLQLYWVELRNPWQSRSADTLVGNLHLTSQLNSCLLISLYTLLNSADALLFRSFRIILLRTFFTLKNGTLFFPMDCAPLFARIRGTLATPNLKFNLKTCAEASD